MAAMVLFPHIDAKRKKYCTFCLSDIDGHPCHGSENIGEFVTADMAKQLQHKFKGRLFIHWLLFKRLCLRYVCVLHL